MKTSTTLTVALFILSVFSDAGAYELIGDSDDFDALDAGDDHAAAIDISNDGKYISVGSPHAGANTQGQVKVYKSTVNEDGSVVWDQFGNTVTGKRPAQHVGISVSISYDATRLVVGSLFDDSSMGSISIFRYLESKNEWKWMSTINGTESGEMFGSNVDITSNGRKVAASSKKYVQVYKCFAKSCVTNGKRIDLPEKYNVRDVAIASGGQSLVIGAGGKAEDAETLAGKVLVYTFDETTQDWVSKQIIDGANEERAGFSVSISEDNKTINVAYSTPTSSCASTNLPNDKINCGGVDFFTSTDRGETFQETDNNIKGIDINGFLGLTIDLSVNGQVITASSRGPENQALFNVYSKNESTGVWNLEQQIEPGGSLAGSDAINSRLSFNGQRIVNVSPGLTSTTNTVNVFDNTSQAQPSTGQDLTTRPTITTVPSASQFPTTRPSISTAPSTSRSPISLFSKSSKSKKAKGKGKGSKSEKSSKGTKASKGPKNRQ